jgi:tetratricopeptide (TPR) repeat protein
MAAGSKNPAVKAAVWLTIFCVFPMLAMAGAWQGRDGRGNRVEVPAAGKANILLFFQPGQAQSQREMAELRAALAERDLGDTQVVGIVSGPGAARQADGVDRQQWPWPVLVDEQYEGSGTFDVHAWPTTVILDKDQKTVGHLPGVTQTYPARVTAYLDFVGGKIDRAQLDEQLTDFRIVQDSADEKADRRLHMFDQLYGAGQPAEAEVQLRQAHDLAPASQSVRLHMARGMLLLDRPREAEDLLQTLDGKGTEAGELPLVRGQAAIALERWADAERLLREAEQQGAGAQAEYYLGLVYQHQNDNRQAAACFRQAYEATTRPTLPR